MVAEASSGTRTASTRATRSSPTARAAAPRSPRTRSRSATKTSRTPPYTCASRCSARTGARRASRCWSGRRRPGRCRATSRSPSRPRSPTSRPAVGEEIADPRRAAARAGAGRGGRGARAPAGLRPGRPRATGAPSSSWRTEPANAFRVVAGDFVTTEDGTGLVHIAPAFGEDDYAVAAANGIFDPTNARHPLQPGQPRRPLRPPRQRLRGPVRQGPRGDPGADRRPRRARPALPRAGLRALLPALLALRHAAALLRQVELVRRHLAGARRSCSPTTRRSAGTPSTSRTAASASGWRTTSTGRSRATATGARRCRSGIARKATATELFCAGSVAELRERARGEVPEDLHRPYIDEVVLDCESCGGEMHRVKSVIDTWYDSGAMPFAQLHYPFENEELFEERFPADFICEAIDQTRGWFYTLLAESTLLFDQSSYRNCVCLGLILDPEGQKMSKSKGNVVEPWDVISAHGADAFRWYYLTAQQPWSGYRFSVDTVGESVRQFLLTLWNTYSFWVLYANAEDLGAGGLRRALPEPSRRPRPLGALEAAVDDRDGARADGRVRLHRRRAGDRRVRRGALQLVRAALAPPLLGGRPRRLRDPAPLPARGRRAARPLHSLPRRRDPPQPRRRRGRSAGRAARLGPPARLPGGRRRRSPTPSSRRRWRRSASRSSSAAPPAPRPRPRCASRCAAP